MKAWVWPMFWYPVILPGIDSLSCRNQICFLHTANTSKCDWPSCTLHLWMSALIQHICVFILVKPLCSGVISCRWLRLCSRSPVINRITFFLAEHWGTHFNCVVLGPWYLPAQSSWTKGVNTLTLHRSHCSKHDWYECWEIRWCT